MSKYSSEFKLEVVKYYFENYGGYGITANHFGISSATSVKEWVRKYKENNFNGLLKNLKSSYSGKFKHNVIKYMHDNHLSATETAIKFNLANHVIVQKWERIYYEEGSQGLYKERRGRSKKNEF